jgi:hypothetical protein
VPKFVMRITHNQSQRRRRRRAGVYSSSSTMMGATIMVFTGAERDARLVISTILKLRTLSLRFVMRNLKAVRHEGITVKFSK